MESRLTNTEISQSYLSTALVKFPKNNHEYRINYNNLRDTIITFEGNCEDYSFFDLAAGYGWNHKRNKQALLNQYSLCKEALPPTLNTDNLPPIMHLSMVDELYKLVLVHRIDMKHSDKSIIFNREITTTEIYFNSSNHQIQNQFQACIPDIPVTTGMYPIFLEGKYPESSWLDTLYKNYRKYNTDDKLHEQNKNSRGLCHIRAHFISHLLHTHGIQTLKVYKFWNPEDWNNYKGEKRWKFHCATMVLDADNQGRICDAWEGLNEQLLTLKQWVYRDNEPRPFKVMITNQAVIADHKNGKEIQAPHFMEVATGCFLNAYQALASSAIPNFPQYGLATNANSFFASTTENPKKRKLMNDENTNISLNEDEISPICYKKFKLIK